MLPINPSQIPEIYKKALTHQKKGELNDALKLYETILFTNPNIAEAYFQTARIYLTRANYKSSVDYFIKALAIKPNERVIWLGYSEALLRLDNRHETSSALKTLASTNLPKTVKQEISQRIRTRSKSTKVAIGNINPADLQSIIAARSAGDFKQMEKSVRSLIRIHPNIAVLYNMLAVSLHGQDRIEETEAAYKKTIELDPNYAEGQSNYGGFLLAQGTPDLALKYLESAHSSIPKSLQNLRALAQSYFELERFPLALETVQKAIKVDANSPELYLLRGKLYTKEKNYPRALSDFRKCQSLGLENENILMNIARAQNDLNDFEGAKATIDLALEKYPESVVIYDALVFILQSYGDFQGADDAFRKLLKIAPDAGVQFRIFSASHKFVSDDPLIAHMEERYQDPALDIEARASFAFALSKAMQDINQDEKVFHYLDIANRLTRELYPYNIQTRRTEVDNIKKAFAGYDFSKLQIQDASDYAPIFVTGMPRSGTTLIEQIIASHSTVTGAGEVSLLPRYAMNLLSKMDGTFNPISSIEGDDIKAMADDYQSAIHDLLPDAGKITDKSIQTYLLMGLVWLALPNAKIIVVRRDPRDNLLSIYRNVFPKGTHLYSYDLHDLGVYYRMFEEVIDFWRDIAPEKFTEIWYDDLIDNPEDESRKLIAACGLEWEDECLNFHKNKRRVDTLSVYQVRQPIYKSSVKAWERYKDHLEPLFKALEKG